jgi:hypothetical protein
MTKQADLKRRIRARMAKTGESYTAARAKLLASRAPSTLHVTNGDSTEHTLAQTGLASRILVWRDVLHDGPVPAGLDPDELAEARRLYPGASFDGTIGQTLASDGTEAVAPPTPRRPSEDHLRRTPALRDRIFVAPAAAALAAVVGVGLVWALAGFSTPKPPSIPDQIATIKRAGSRGGREARVPVRGPLDLHGSGGESYFFYFRDRPGVVAAPRSDRLEIWDKEGDRLKRRVSFEPDGPRAVFEFASVADIDADGAAEVVGGYALAAEARQAPVPFAVDWDDEARRYRLVALDREPPTLSNMPLERRYRVPERQYRAVYAKRLSFADRRSGLSFTGRRVQEFIITRPPRLVAAYFLQPPLDAVHNRAVLELHPSILSATSGQPKLRPCELQGGPPARVDFAWQSRSLPKAVEEAWAAASRDRLCPA